MDSANKVAEACKFMEPIEANAFTENEARGVEVTALQSIAISLKRIADSMEKDKSSAEFLADLAALRKSSSY